MRTVKTRSSTSSSPHWPSIPGCCAVGTATGSWCCTQGVLLQSRSRPAARSCRRPAVAARASAQAQRSRCCRQRSLATVRSTTESSTDSRECRESGTNKRSPGEPFHRFSPATRVTRPWRTWTVASPGFSCSSRLVPARSAIKPGAGGARAPRRWCDRCGRSRLPRRSPGGVGPARSMTPSAR